MARRLSDGVSEQAKAAKHRMDDARALLDTRRWRGAMYLAGYSVECLLKTKLMRMFTCSNLRELEEGLRRKGRLGTDATVFSHQLEPLLRLTGGLDRLRQNEPLWKSFNIVNRWIPAWRYNPNLSTQEEAEDFLDAIEKVGNWIEHSV